ncbi:MAG: redox-sensing transcriptional repressor Rex [Sporomusaceae bacterium]|nr:redox-sensing transcriptional repressor Rex [Sporomusaceae bacterium]
MKDSNEKNLISKATIDRLPLYFRTLRLSQEEGVEIISSEELGQRLGITPEQIRKDLASFGQFGKKGVGYYILELIKNIGNILGLDNNWHLAVVGVGHLGWALAHYRNFDSLGFKLVAMFDIDPNKIGQCIKGIKVSSLDSLKEVMEEQTIHIGIIAVPEIYAQEVADKLVAAGVRGIWNFAPRKIKVPDTVRVINEDLSIGLSSLSFYLARQTQV